MWDAAFGIILPVARKFRQQLARFLREQRGDASFVQFARKTGISPSTLQRLEVADQNITVDTLEELLHRLGLDLSAVFRADRS